MTAPRDQRDPLVSGPARWRWPGGATKDVNIGSGARTPSDSVDQPAGFRKPWSKTATKPAQPRTPALTGETGPPAAWRTLPVQAVLLVAVLYHAAPQISRLTGEGAARALFGYLGDRTPHLLGVDVGHWLALGASAWFWQPVMAALGAGVLRWIALNTVRRDPIGAIWIGATALAIDAASWVFIGLKLSDASYSPDEGAALVTLLKVEAAVLFGLFCLLAPTGRKKLGETDAHFNRG